MSAGNPVPASRACACTVVHPRHDGKRVAHAARARLGGWRCHSRHRHQPLLFVLQDQDTGVVPFMVPAGDPSPPHHYGATRRDVQPTVGSPLHSGLVGQLELARDRPPHRGEGHGQKEGQEGAEGQDDPEEAARAGRADHSCDDRRSVRESATEEELVGRLGHASGTYDGSRAAQTEGNTGSPLRDQRPQFGLSLIRQAAAVG